ncbi:MAG: Hsp20 family protein [Candidatus Pelagibacterales bacterium]|nr:MAG: Hsp20 family protein [Pelagibacterales bacterium]
MMKELSIFNQLRPVTVGFDSVFDNFERIFSDDFFSTPSSYPAYNIVKTKDNHYDVEVALAGFNKKDIMVSYADGQLSIESVKNNQPKDEDGNIIHRGIAKRYFKKSFSVADNCEVKSAELKDGLLRVSLERIIPEEKKPRVIDIK